jgi:hypothetical protein
MEENCGCQGLNWTVETRTARGGVMSSIIFLFTNIIRMIRSRRMRWVGHVECMGEIREAYKNF